MSVEKHNAPAAADAASPTPASDAPAASAAAASASDTSPSAEAPKIEPPAAAAAPQKADAPAESIRRAQITIFDPLIAGASESERPGYLRHAPLAASVVLAAVLGSLVGAAATVHYSRDAASLGTEARTAETTQSLHQSVAQLGSEIATLKASLAVVQRNTGVQSGKLAERVERIEKAEPAAKLAKLSEAVDRLERRTAPAATDATGSIAPGAKQETKPLYAEGWRLRDYYAGRAVVESRNGRLFEVGPGSNLPGLGRVDAIKREDGRIVVVTPNGLIAASIEPRRIPMPYRY